MHKVRCTKIIEAQIPDVGLREIGRIYEVVGVGSFFTKTKEIELPAGKCVNYGINCTYLFATEGREHNHV